MDAEVLALEQELQSRHSAELLELQSQAVSASTEELEGGVEKGGEGEGVVTEALGRLKVEREGGEEDEGTGKKSRAQKRKVSYKL